MELLEQSLKHVFGAQASSLILPPERIAILIRSTLEGLIVELALARTPLELESVNQAYRDFRMLFEQSILKESP